MADPRNPRREKPQRFEPQPQPGDRSDEERRERRTPERPEPRRRAPDPDDPRYTPTEDEA